METSGWSLDQGSDSHHRYHYTEHTETGKLFCSPVESQMEELFQEDSESRRAVDKTHLV